MMFKCWFIWYTSIIIDFYVTYVFFMFKNIFLNQREIFIKTYDISVSVSHLCPVHACIVHYAAAIAVCYIVIIVIIIMVRQHICSTRMLGSVYTRSNAPSTWTCALHSTLVQFPQGGCSACVSPYQCLRPTLCQLPSSNP